MSTSLGQGVLSRWVLSEYDYWGIKFAFLILENGHIETLGGVWILSLPTVNHRSKWSMCVNVCDHVSLQYEPGVLEACLQLLQVSPQHLSDKHKDYILRADPVYLSRVVCAMVRKNTDFDSGDWFCWIVLWHKHLFASECWNKPTPSKSRPGSKCEKRCIPTDRLHLQNNSFCFDLQKPWKHLCWRSQEINVPSTRDDVLLSLWWAPNIK